MSSLFGSNAQSTADMQQKKEQLKQQVQQELAVAGAQQLINKITENCFQKCITRPASTLGSSDERCLTQCMTLYMAAFDQTSRSYVTRLAKERASQ